MFIQRLSIEMQAMLLTVNGAQWLQEEEALRWHEVPRLICVFLERLFQVQLFLA